MILQLFVVTLQIQRLWHRDPKVAVGHCSIDDFNNPSMPTVPMSHCSSELTLGKTERVMSEGSFNSLLDAINTFSVQQELNHVLVVQR